MKTTSSVETFLLARTSIRVVPLRRNDTACESSSVNGDAAVFAAPARAGVATRTAVTKGSEEMLSMESVRSISVRVLGKHH